MFYIVHFYHSGILRLETHPKHITAHKMSSSTCTILVYIDKILVPRGSNVFLGILPCTVIVLWFVSLGTVCCCALINQFCVSLKVNDQCHRGQILWCELWKDWNQTFVYYFFLLSINHSITSQPALMSSVSYYVTCNID